MRDRGGAHQRDPGERRFSRKSRTRALSLRAIAASYASAASSLRPARRQPWSVRSARRGPASPSPASGPVAQAIVLSNPGDLTHPLFDGTNLWVPDGANSSVYGVRPSTGQVVATLTVAGFAPTNVVFDGERFFVASLGFVSLFRASDLTSLGEFPTGIAADMNICSEGLNFWIVPAALTGSPQRLFRF